MSKFATSINSNHFYQGDLKIGLQLGIRELLNFSRTPSFAIYHMLPFKKYKI